VALMIAHLTAVAWCFGAAGVAASGWASRRASALGYVAVAALAMFLIDFLGLWWAPLGQLARLTPFYYFHGGAILSGAANPALNLTILGGVTVVLVVLAYWRFEKRDL
jgi:ABC-type transport system involved in multi-copper enzyme maturation permease subunit